MVLKWVKLFSWRCHMCSVAESHVRVDSWGQWWAPSASHKAIHLTRRPIPPQWGSNQKYWAKKKQAEKIATEARPALHIPATPDPATTISGSSIPWANGQAGAKRTFFSSMTTALIFYSKIDHPNRKAQLSRWSTANLAFRWTLTHVTPSVFHAEQRSGCAFLIWTLWPEFWSNPHLHGGPQHQQIPGTDFRA